MKKTFFITFAIYSLLFGICHAQWVQMNNGMGNLTVYSLAVSGNNFFAGTWNNGVYLSTNNGTSWTQTSLNNRVVHSLAVKGNNIFAGTLYYGVYLLTDNGTSWTQTSLNNQSVISLAVNGNDIFAGTFSNGVFLSTNNGTSWTQTSLNNRIVNALAVNGNNIFAGTILGYGVYVSTNNGTNWIQRNEGLVAFYIYTLCILNNYIFAGTGDSSVYRRPLGELTGIQPISNEVPNQFSLSQNYPNPFNPVTKIRFDIPPGSSVAQTFPYRVVNLSVYDILGREVATLVNEELKPGTYEVEWNAAKYSSGVYFYRIAIHSDKLLTEDYSETRKMMLIK